MRGLCTKDLQFVNCSPDIDENTLKLKLQFNLGHSIIKKIKCAGVHSQQQMGHCPNIFGAHCI
jgi:hypothetical protein